MSQPFDTGAIKSLRELVQDKVISILQQFHVSQPGGFLEAIIPIAYRATRGGDEENHPISMLISEDFREQSPAIAVAALDLHSEQAGGPGNSMGVLELEIYAYSAHRRARTDGRARMDPTALADNTADPGIFAILELVWSRLFDADLRPATTHHLKRRLEQEIMTGSEGSLWRQNWTVSLTYDANLARGITQRLTEIRSRLHLQPDDPPKAEIDVTTTLG